MPRALVRLRRFGTLECTGQWCSIIQLACPILAQAFHAGWAQRAASVLGTCETARAGAGPPRRMGAASGVPSTSPAFWPRRGVDIVVGFPAGSLRVFGIEALIAAPIDAAAAAAGSLGKARPARRPWRPRRSRRRRRRQARAAEHHLHLSWWQRLHRPSAQRLLHRHQGQVHCSRQLGRWSQPSRRLDSRHVPRQSG